MQYKNQHIKKFTLIMKFPNLHNLFLCFLWVVCRLIVHLKSVKLSLSNNKNDLMPVSFDLELRARPPWHFYFLRLLLCPEDAGNDLTQISNSSNSHKRCLMNVPVIRSIWFQLQNIGRLPACGLQ
jgi:hypothetical protein